MPSVDGPIDQVACLNPPLRWQAYVADAERAVAKVEEWAAESRDVAASAAYSFGGSPVAIVFSFDRHAHVDVAHMAPLPAGHSARARGVAEKLVALAGHRLADRLRAVLR